jgi:hypothetical protein
MKYYQTTTRFNCGIDLHARQMYVCVVDRQGKKLLHQNIQNNDFAFFLKKIAPWKHDLTVVCECLFCFCPNPIIASTSRPTWPPSATVTR